MFVTDTMAELAEKLGMSQGDAGSQLSNILPSMIVKPILNGHIPAGGLGSAGDLMDVLGKLLQKI